MCRPFPFFCFTCSEMKRNYYQDAHLCSWLLVNSNQIKFEPCADLVDKVYSYYNLNISYNQDSCGQIENDESLLHAVYSNDEDERTKQKFCKSKCYARIMADGEILESINSLNSKQHVVSNVNHNWAREYAKHKDVNV